MWGTPLRRGVPRKLGKLGTPAGKLQLEFISRGHLRFPRTLSHGFMGNNAYHFLLAGAPCRFPPEPPPQGGASQARQVRGTTAGKLQIKFISRNTCGFPEPFPADLWETTRINFISGVPSAGRATQIKSPFTNTPENAKSCTQTCNKPQKFFKIPPRSPFFWTFQEKFGMKTGKKIPPDKWAERCRGMRAVNG